MSIVVYRDGVIACDTSGFRGGVVNYNKGKILKGERTGCLYGFTGGYAFISKLKKWIIEGEQGSFEEYADNLLDSTDDEIVCTVMVITPDKRIDIWTPSGYEIDVNTVGYEAIGGPYELAYGALYMGATARDAVKACIFHSEYAQGDVVTLTL